MAHDGNVIDDTTFATGDDNSHMHTTTMGTHEHTDEILRTTGDNKISAPPPAAASTYYTSFNEEEVSPAEYNTSIDNTQVVNQPPAPAATNNSNSASKKASMEYEQLLSSTIISLFQKFVPALHKRLSSSSNNNNNDDETNRSELVLQSSRSLEFADGYGGNYKTAGLDNNDDDDAVLDVESQSFSASPYPSERISTTATPKVSNLKTTGLDSSDRHQLQRQHSNSSEYLPQSAAVLLNTLQHTNFDRGAEEILSSILRSGGSSSFDEGDTTDVREGEGGSSGELLVDGNNDGGGVNADGSASKKKKLTAATTKTQDATTKSTNNSFEQQSQQHNYDDDDDNSISGDMARLSRSIAHLQRDLDNIDMSRFDGMVDMEQQDLLDGGGGSRGNGWKRWIRNWLLSHGIIEDEKMVNSLLSDDDVERGGDDGSIITPGRGGFTIFDFERDYVLVLTLLLVFFVLLRNRFKTMNDLMFEEEDNQDLEGLLGGSDW